MNTVDRLQEKRNIEKALQILESAGYKVTKRLNESDELDIPKLSEVIAETDIEYTPFFEAIAKHMNIDPKLISVVDTEITPQYYKKLLDKFESTEEVQDLVFEEFDGRYRYSAKLGKIGSRKAFHYKSNIGYIFIVGRMTKSVFR